MPHVRMIAFAIVAASAAGCRDTTTLASRPTSASGPATASEAHADQAPDPVELLVARPRRGGRRNDG